MKDTMLWMRSAFGFGALSSDTAIGTTSSQATASRRLVLLVLMVLSAANAGARMLGLVLFTRMIVTTMSTMLVPPLPSLMLA